MYSAVAIPAVYISFSEMGYPIDSNSSIYSCLDLFELFVRKQAFYPEFLKD